ncbi:hypothetical protein NAC44_03645 [Allorhizobium sp. BGMRC 0089]|uniref:hypothetical protein n=1 Tax=Allorhizobium sonneratiae TaxID=2934936 RepID=UPI002033F3BC|nr:hypothetical protein [Allorhizobium sonneratiae]MCM2291421.1 hypothetical protein [Allorhizobium sonneratiae]
MFLGFSAAPDRRPSPFLRQYKRRKHKGSGHGVMPGVHPFCGKGGFSIASPADFIFTVDVHGGDPRHLDSTLARQTGVKLAEQAENNETAQTRDRF